MYSQQGEDDIYGPLLPEYGHLIDIGAWHPVQMSNSRMLIERGWDAVLIEPSPGPLHALVKEYGGNEKVTVIAAAVGVEAGLTRLRITDDAVSTGSHSVQEVWEKQGGYFGWLHVPTLTLASIFNSFGGNFEFVNIDTEGSSVDLACAYLEAGPEPLVMCVEHDGRIVELTQKAQAHGYYALHINDTNVILKKGVQ